MEIENEFIISLKKLIFNIRAYLNILGILDRRPRLGRLHFFVFPGNDKFAFTYGWKLRGKAVVTKLSITVQVCM